VRTRDETLRLVEQALVDHPEANVYEIANLCGISRSYVSSLLSDPTGERQMARRQSYAGVCVDCGAPTSSSGTSRPSPRCVKCAGVLAAARGKAMIGTGSTQKKIIDALAGGELRYMEIVRATGIPINSLNQTLKRLRVNGLVQRPRRGVYRLPPRPRARWWTGEEWVDRPPGVESAAADS
jgi:DNA-binding transcriptional ArsR family regulator